MNLDAFLGNAEPVERLKTALQKGTLPHAILLSGPDGCGRGYLARLLAADLLYPDGAAAQAVIENRDPEFLVVAGEGRSGNIPVEKIRTVRSEVYHSSLSAKGRVVWIRDAHRMMAPAANALLKVLEEPPAGVTFLLTTRDASALPVTIQSRCTHFPLTAVPLEACEAYLAQHRPDGVDTGWPRRLARLYSGRIGLGRKAMQNPERLAVVQDALRAAQAAFAQNTYGILRVFSGYEGRADGENDRRDALLSDISSVLESSLLGQLEELPSARPQTAARLLAPIGDTRMALRANAAPKTAFTMLALQMGDAAAG